ncbi:uncharacterized protein LOC133188962 [Saccostrea echinata]|uniref:uncharacterized protein LOC133188962 n=1 Tax=Saccostrea echinata TaxID=191078 RepID=UPI002A835BC3|nr:uncharacterized protein LOC133188962 [Saccostrea echinata]
MPTNSDEEMDNVSRQPSSVMVSSIATTMKLDAWYNLISHLPLSPHCHQFPALMWCQSTSQLLSTTAIRHTPNLKLATLAGQAGSTRTTLRTQEFMGIMSPLPPNFPKPTISVLVAL